MAFIRKALLIAFGGYTALSAVLYASFIMDRRTTTTEVAFPFITKKSADEYVLNCALMFSIFIHAFFLYLGMETVMSIFENVTTVSTELIRNEILQMDSSHERNELSNSQLRAVFKNILLQTNDFDRCVCDVTT